MMYKCMIGIHEGGITSVQFSPVNSTHVLTRGTDSTFKIVDARTNTAVATMWHSDCHTSQSWSVARYSPDGQYVLAGSSSSGNLFVWSAADGSLQNRISGHSAGVAAVDWSRGGSNGQQVASLDRKGSLILWA
jgi:autophagy-related protein 16-1